MTALGRNLTDTYFWEKEVEKDERLLAELRDAGSPPEALALAEARLIQSSERLQDAENVASGRLGVG